MKDKRQQKTDKHFPIYVDGHKCLILNYRIENNRLTIITKNKNSDLEISGDKGKIVIEKDGVKTEYIIEQGTVHHGITIFNYEYRILEEKAV